MMKFNREQITNTIEILEGAKVMVVNRDFNEFQNAIITAINALSTINELTEENERLRLISTHICVGDVIFPEEMEELRMAHTWSGQHGDPVGEPGECGIKHKCVSETIKKMQERLKNYLREVADGDIGYSWIDKIAKEMLEENK